MKELAIVGAGPAGMGAAIYAGRYRRDAVLVAEELGGQMALISELDNYPGFPQGIAGHALADLMRRQAERFGTEFLFDRVRSVDFSTSPLKLFTESGKLEARAVILATGTAPRKLDVPGEERLMGRGISYCATCDGFFYRGKRVAVVGGSNYAVEDALALTRFATHVTIIHDQERLGAVAELRERASQHPDVDVLASTDVIDILGEGTVSGVRLRDQASGMVRELPVDGVFIFRGRSPNSAFLTDWLTLDERGYAVADESGRTELPGVFVAGSLRAGTQAQVVTCVGSGAVAAMTAERYLAL